MVRHVAAGPLLLGEQIPQPVDEEGVGGAGEELVFELFDPGRLTGDRLVADHVRVPLLQRVGPQVAQLPLGVEVAGDRLRVPTDQDQAALALILLDLDPTVVGLGAVLLALEATTQLRLAKSRPNMTRRTTPTRRSGAFTCAHLPVASVAGHPAPD